MDITVNRKELEGVLAIATRVVEKRTTIPSLSHVALEASGDRLRIRATDLDMEVSCTIAATVRKAGAATMNAHMLHDVARRAPGIDLKIVADGKLGRAVITAGKARSTLPTLPIADFPDITTGDMKVTFTMPKATMRDLMERGGACHVSEDPRYYLCGVHMHRGHDSTLVAVATDGHRLSKMAVDLPAGAAGMPGIIIPTKMVTEIGKLCAGAGDVQVQVNDTKIRITVGDVAVVSKLVDGTYPDYARVIPSGHMTVATVNRTDLIEAVNRVSVVSEERGRAVRLSFQPSTVGNGLDGDTLALSLRASDAGEAADEVPLTIDGPAIEIGFNSRYLAGQLGLFRGDVVRILMQDGSGPAKFNGPEEVDAGLECILMPMRI